MRLRFPLAIVFGLAVLATAAFGGAGGPKTKLISRTSGGDAATGGGSREGVVTPDGRYVAFESFAANLPGPGTQIYVRDRETEKTSLVSRNSAGETAGGGVSSGLDPSISANGRFVAFESDATNLPGAVGVGDTQIYVRDLKKDKTRLVSKTTDGEPADGNSDDPSVSGNGRWVAFESENTNLPGGLGADDQTYVRDLKAEKTKLVSKTTAGEAANDESDDSEISRNGRFVGFESVATNLPHGLGGLDDQVYVRDLDEGTTKLVSRTTAGQPGDADSEDPMLSATGRFVGFDSHAGNLPGAGTYYQVYLRDLKRSKTVLVSKTTAGDPASGDHSNNTSVSDSGRFVAFSSAAVNLPGSISPNTQIYVRDRAAGKTRLVSKANDGSPGDDGSFISRGAPSLTADARFVVFDSLATNLPGANGDNQVYIRGPLR